MKGCAEKLIEKMEVISTNIVSHRRFKANADKRISRLEERLNETLTLDKFRTEMHDCETRILNNTGKTLDAF